MMNLRLKPNDKFIGDLESDYGSDLSSDEEQIVESLISKIISPNNVFNTTKNPKLYPLLSSEKNSDSISCSLEDIEQETCKAFDQESPNLNTDKSVKISRTKSHKSCTRSPLRQFRSSPYRGLTVTDLATPAWCEVKYWYSLTNYGVQKKTPAMLQGTRVHEKLENEDHITVPIQICTREDRLGLKIWNIVQGLRMLREHGCIREFQIWGLIDGQLVGGKIDELFYESPSSETRTSIDQNKVKNGLNPFADYLIATDAKAAQVKSKPLYPNQNRKICICDVKTRTKPSIPSEVMARSTKYQLMLYHRLISDIATGQFELQSLTTRYKLDPVRVFSDSFVAQICGLDKSCFDPNPLQQSSFNKLYRDQPLSQESVPLISVNNTLSALWSLMLSEFRQTFPHGVDSLSNLLKAEYRSNENGEIIGAKFFLMDDAALTDYLEKSMQWWRGEREPLGVNAEEAFKCRCCEFIESCEWRLKKAKEHREKSILKKQQSTDAKSRTVESV